MERIYIKRIYKGIQGKHGCTEYIRVNTGYTVLLRVNIGTEDK